MMFVKVCGIKTGEALEAAIALGYSAVGIVVYDKSPRFCAKDLAVGLADLARGRIISVAVAIELEEVMPVADRFDFVQICGPAPGMRLIFAGHNAPCGEDFELFCLDQSMGSGSYAEPPEWTESIRDRLIIAGGLTIKNVGKVIERYRPFGVDVSSGVESARGVKDITLMKEFIKEVANARP